MENFVQTKKNYFKKTVDKLVISRYNYFAIVKKANINMYNLLEWSNFGVLNKRSMYEERYST